MDQTYDRKAIRKKIKRHAKDVLHRDLWGNVGLIAPWMIVIYIIFIYSYATTSVTTGQNETSTGQALFEALFSLIFAIITAYTIYVAEYQSLKQMRDETTTAKPVESWFKTYLTKKWQKTIWLSIWMTFLFLIGWALLISFGHLGVGLSSITMTLYALSNISIPTFLVVSFIISFIVFAVFVIIYLMKQYKYIFIPFVGLDDPSTKGFKLVAKSRELMKGHRWELFVMHLSFFWWFLLIGVTLGLASFYVMPYIYLTLAGYYDTINDIQKKKEAKVTEQPAPIKAVVLQPNSTY
ncbi:DUF975 family protein [Weissella bombi]|uniref:Uncharacterized membrane protein n=1 Tax=Weissella bombi TaxID=1505725 RepID=A0A1C3Z0A9_9LACO|nr:DUF975 family protein [Weissella bombi]SCB75749.1 Uncharacterized membrane protein [Weissella bombi]